MPDEHRDERRDEHRDVVVVGAGLSGIGAAAQLARRLPHLSVAVLEARDRLGGTWDLFRYPGVRSDSDMYTLGYRFEPWAQGAAIADGPSILRYLERTARRYGVDRLIRYRHHVVEATWSSRDARWTLHIDGPDGNRTRLTCGFLQVCTGYFRYDAGYTPPIPGLSAFAGQVVHPQHWPEDIDVRDRRVVVIGSGATAVTLVPALASTAEHVTMLQRSPSYVLPRPSRDPVADRVGRVLPPRAAAPLLRWKNLLASQVLYELSRRRPDAVRRFVRGQQAPLLPAGFDRTHLTPAYDPWDQRLCLAADGDLFASLSSGRASIVTDAIEAVVPDGVRLASGATLGADVLVTATGLTLLALGGMALRVDGRPVDLPSSVLYKGTMICGVPNLAYTVGYTNASWTLKADLVSDYVCRLLRHMRRRGYAAAVPRPPDPAEPRAPLIDLQAGYVQRSLGDVPSQGSRPPWRLHQSYPRDVLLLRHGRLEDGVLQLLRPADLRSGRLPTEVTA